MKKYFAFLTLLLVLVTGCSQPNPQVEAVKTTESVVAVQPQHVARWKHPSRGMFRAVPAPKPKPVKVTIVKHKETDQTTPTGSSLAPSGVARCIAHYESNGNPRAENPTSSASGLYQFIDGTWNNYGGYRRAKDAPVSVQTRKFNEVWAGGRGARNWVTYRHCT